MYARPHIETKEKLQRSNEGREETNQKKKRQHNHNNKYT
jgi:hypothetical protein